MIELRAKYILMKDDFLNDLIETNNLIGRLTDKIAIIEEAIELIRKGYNEAKSSQAVGQ